MNWSIPPLQMNFTVKITSHFTQSHTSMSVSVPWKISQSLRRVGPYKQLYGGDMLSLLPDPRLSVPTDRPDSLSPTSRHPKLCSRARTKYPKFCSVTRCESRLEHHLVLRPQQLHRLHLQRRFWSCWRNLGVCNRIRRFSHWQCSVDSCCR